MSLGVGVAPGVAPRAAGHVTVEIACALRPLDASHDELLRSLEEQEDVWEFIGTLPFPPAGSGHHLFAVVADGVAVGIAGLVRSRALEGEDFELLCAIRAEAQLHGFAQRACKLALAWAFDTAKLERVIACIDNDNEAARSIALKLGMKQLAPSPPNRTVYVTYRDERASITPSP